MKKNVCVILVTAMVSGLFLFGCAQQKEASSSTAIEKSKTMATVQQKENYLIEQAKVFYNSKEFQDTINTAQYVLSSLDKNSKDAKDILEKAKASLAAAAQKAAGNVKQSLGGILK
jgi:hypothetical protein